MSIFVAWLFERRGRSDPYVECRRCGATLSSATVACPACDSTRTATYDIE